MSDKVQKTIEKVWSARSREDIEVNLPSDYQLDDFAEEIACRLQEEYPDKFGDIDLSKVVFLRKDYKKKASGVVKKVKRAEAKPVKKPEYAFSQFTHIITTWGENFTELPLDKKQKVIYHELLHVPPNNVRGTIVDHDVEDFADCINKWGGTHWVYEGDDQLLVQMKDEVVSKPSKD